MSITYGEWVKRVFVGILEHEERTGKDSADLTDVCTQKGIEANDDWLVRFVNENQPHFGFGTAMFGMYAFTLNPPGRDNAVVIRKAAAPRTLLDRLTGETSQRLINLGNFAIAALALLVALAALTKD